MSSAAILLSALRANVSVWELCSALTCIHMHIICLEFFILEHMLKTDYWNLTLKGPVTTAADLVLL